MAAFGFRRRRTRRFWYFGATTAVLAAAVLLFVAAASGTLPGSSFDTSNGSLTDTSIHDWNPAGSPTGNVGPLQTIDCGTTIPNSGTNCGTDLTGSSSDNAFGQGAKEDDPAPTVVSGSIPPSKDDLSRFYVNQEQTATNDFLYLAWERTNLLGSAHMDFEFNQSNVASANGVTKVRTDGDLLISFDFGGSGIPVLDLRRWVTSGVASTVCDSANSVPCWGKPTNLTATGFAEGSVNAVNVTDNNPPGNPRILAGTTSSNGTISSTFGEAGINLTGANIFPRNVCEHFGSTHLTSRSSGSSFTSELKDFIAPIPVNISNCGEIKIIKETNPRGVDHAFGFHNVDIPASGPTFSHALDGSGNFTLNDVGNTTADSAGNTQDITNVPAGTYHVTEADPTPGFDLTGLSCSTGGSGDVPTRTATITLTVGATVTCTFTNTQRGTIIVKKVTVPSPDLTNTSFAYTGDASGSIKNGQTITVNNLVPGTYTSTETDPSSLGFDLTSIQCDDGSSATPSSGNVGTRTATFKLDPGETVTCTFTNTLRLGAIRVTKESSKSGNALLSGAKFVVKDGQGNVVTNGNLTTGSAGTACVDHLKWAGTGTDYTVTETVAPSGYAIDNGNPVTVTVQHNADCNSTSGVPNAPAAFTDTPLTDLVITATSEASGGTKSSIECTSGAPAGFPGTDIAPPVGPVDPASVTANGLMPGTYTCKVVIDP